MGTVTPAPEGCHDDRMKSGTLFRPHGTQLGTALNSAPTGVGGSWPGRLLVSLDSFRRNRMQYSDRTAVGMRQTSYLKEIRFLSKILSGHHYAGCNTPVSVIEKL